MNFKVQIFFSIFSTLPISSLSQINFSLKPEPASVINATFHLYTSQTVVNPEILDYKNPKSISESHFLGNLSTIIIIHGYREEPLKSNHWAQIMKKEFLTERVMNIIVVRWSDGAYCINYFQSAENTRTVGVETANLITKLIDIKHTSISKFHLIGHSLGAQACGFAGKRLPHLARITGLDPAGPGFNDADVKNRLDHTDALFVDVIHTNAKPLIEGGFGYEKPCGHVDFFPNGGKDMPGCFGYDLDTVDIFKESVLNKLFLDCSHGRSVHYFIESINSQCQFCSYPCKDYPTYKKGYCKSCSDHSCSSMGYYANEWQGKGSLYLKTNAKTPYCILDHCSSKI